MATLVLSTVGAALGGPIGGALGSLIGGAIDAQLFGPGPRHGPRLGDLSIQTSSYGSPIPRIYGAMRVAGSVVWATDLKEEQNIAGGGKSGPEVISYAYSASFAVALSSRPAKRIGRVWADGKLLRGSAGDMKTPGKLRFYGGSEDQGIDPLIASVEGAGLAAAFRGLVLAVFEDLALVDYGNRIPVITFELVADEGAVAVADLVADVCRGEVASASGGPTVGGFAAHGDDRRSALSELIELTGVDVVEVDGVLAVAGSAAAVGLAAKDARSCVADGERAKAADQESRRQIPARSLPRSLALTYYDPARDYQSGQARAVISGGGRTEWRADSPVVLDASAAKAIANAAMARRWATRDRMTVRLDPSFATLVPGTGVTLPDVAGLWTIESVSVEQLVVVVELRREASGGTVLAADSGRALSEADVAIGVTDVALFDAPDLGFGTASGPSLRLAASSAGGFRAVPVTISVNGLALTSLSVPRRAALGRSASALGFAPAELLDLSNFVDVQLTTSGQILLNAEDSALAMGANAMLVGGELIQFGRALQLLPGRFRLSRLLRGRRGTEWAVGTHGIGERVVVVDRATLVEVALDRGAIGATVSAVAHGLADNPLTPPTASLNAQGEGLKPLAPAHVALMLGSAGTGSVSWQPRSVAGLAWVDGTGDPDLTGRRFAVAVTRGSASWSGEVLAATSIAIDAAGMTALGHGVASVNVTEIGSFGTSRAAIASAII